MIKKILSLATLTVLVSCQNQGLLNMINNNPTNTEVGAQALREQEITRDFNKLTENGTTLPSSMTVNDFIGEATSSPEAPCEARIDTETPEDLARAITTPAAEGVKKVLATFFQSCKALDEVIGPETPPLRGIKRIKTHDPEIPYVRKLVNRDAYVNSHIILQKLKKDPDYPGAMCKDMTKTPPIYGYGSRKYPNRSNELNLFSEGAGVARSSKDSVAIDCSSFISVALASQGLKISKSATKYESLTTTNFDQQVGRRDSCLSHVNFQGEDTVMPGDMINLAGSHIVMIDTVSSDPLAVKKFAALGKCNEISIEDFDFTYIHSGSIKNNYGPSRVHVRTHKGGTMFNNLRIAAVKQCKRIAAKNNGEVNTDKLTPNSKFALIRHQTEKPECKTDDKLKLRNEECVGDCST